MNFKPPLPVFGLPSAKTIQGQVPINALRRILDSLRRSSLSLVLAFSAPISVSAAAIGQTFATPDDAVSALGAAVRAQDTNALRVILGPAAEDLENPDRVQAANELNAFTTALDQSKRIVHESDSKCVLEVGDNPWPFPVPIVAKDGRWFFDTEAGEEELLNRRIGRNELSVIAVMRAYVDAQREYASRDRNGDEVLEYAQRLASSPGNKDGLYWPPDLDGELSPLGPFVANAQTEGYQLTTDAGNADRAPFHGYYFKILMRQGRHAPGGKYDYVINGHMIGGFALVAWPAEYGTSGVMTFIVNQQGKVYQQDLGKKTTRIARTMTTYDPGPGWSLSVD
ncbi:MAG TPA: DUF2950 domain-containing protein [Verrucomicrobiota bacterium]|nr:DUF2950 domain-containing protein [Verrucomicrobiales bacterium]HRI13338.1 DUF2950 domain-containing protein [Verrucomicrobiota bacterium]